jgi:tetrahedral aminopeptidase
VDLLPAVKALSDAAGVSGFESEVRALVRAQWEPFVDEFREDALGNQIAIRRGNAPAGEPRRAIMLATHCDEIGLMVTGIQEGFLRVTDVGGFDPRVLPGQEVIVHGRQSVPGIIGLRPPHVTLPEERDQPVPLSELFVDVGMTQEAAESTFDPGDPITMHVQATELRGERLTGKALDNRVSVAAAGYCLSLLKGMQHSWDVYAVATSQEEVGLRGAIVSAYGLAPDLAIAIDVTFGAAPGLPETETFKMDGGPTIGFGPNVHPAMHTALVDTANALEMSYQVEPLPGSSGTDGWALQVSREGIPTAIVSIPVLNMHTPVEVVAIADVRRTGRLLAEFIRNLDSSTLDAMAIPLPGDPDAASAGEHRRG